MAYINNLLHKAWIALLEYKHKGYFSFIGSNILKVAFYYALVVIGVILIGKYVLDLNQIFRNIIAGFTSDSSVLLLFFVSESLLGMIPPDLFMMWAGKFNNPLLMLTFLGLLSYLGGIVSYKIGSWISTHKKAKAYIETRLQNYVQLTQKWGGTFIALSALFPFSPFATVVLAVSILKYPFRLLLLFGLFRVLRFVGQGVWMSRLIDFTQL